ncbi:hypothetical protein [Aromatoleum diolicum]|uniref:Nitrogen fixation protein NifZ n=1 Tax=Aromatoleum diolicum TaxID=75796 RepID=A0ABX1Q9L9_9RHOO|nr:hypothetical protein [Aromatoleum diolicum]NMG74668.1 hypothetical protein [Aromatoleum diolicum]
MTNRITIPAADVRVGDHIYDGPGANAHPTFAWETITQVKLVDGLVVVVVGRLEATQGEFWFEPDEPVTIIRYPAAEPEKAVPKSHHKHGHGHSG